MKTQKISYEGMKEIYSIACDGWKKKIKSWTNVFDDTELTNDQVQEMFNAASTDQKKVLNKYLKEYVSTINSWDDVLTFHNIKEVIVPFPNPKTKEEKCLNAMTKGFKIAQAFNGGKELSWEDRSYVKYYPYKYCDGGSWAFHFCYCLDSAHFLVGLCFLKSKDVMKATELFPEIYNDILMFG